MRGNGLILWGVMALKKPRVRRRNRLLPRAILERMQLQCEARMFQREDMLHVAALRLAKRRGKPRYIV